MRKVLALVPGENSFPKCYFFHTPYIKRIGSEGFIFRCSSVLFFFSNSVMEYLIDDISDYQLDETESHEIFLLKKLALNSKHSQDIYSFLHSLYDVGKSSLKSSKSDCLFVCSAVEVIDSVIKRS